LSSPRLKRYPAPAILIYPWREASSRCQLQRGSVRAQTPPDALQAELPAVSTPSQKSATHLFPPLMARTPVFHWAHRRGIRQAPFSAEVDTDIVLKLIVEALFSVSNHAFRFQSARTIRLHVAVQHRIESLQSVFSRSMMIL
jgi:hypothetical protein